MSLKWSEGIMMKFLELYQKYDCLWDHRTDKYRNRDAREDALGCIVKEMESPGITIADIKNKIKVFRTMYKKEHSLVCKSIHSGMARDELYVPKLFWYKRADIFLNGVTNTRNTSSNLNSQHDEAESETIENAGETKTENMFPASTSASITTDNGDTQKEAIHVENTKTANSPTTKQSKTTNVFRAPQNRKRKIAENENISNISAAIDKLDEVVQKNTRNVDDEFDIFAKHIAVQLRQMPLYDAIICQEQIQTVVRQKRLQLLLVRQSEYHTTPSSVCPPSQYYFHTTPSPAFSPSEYHSSPSPALSNNMDPEHSSSSFSNESCNRQHCGEDSQKSSDILTAALTGVLNLE